ncbi:MAG: N-6 DNA methylase [Bacteroidetes bacterium]|nr:N-6 DNA methylase [Bacteroidota bacterium]
MYKVNEGYVKDYISGEQVRATPEEVDAVQVFCKQLVEDYKYPKSHIQTHPQYRVKMRPSDTRKEYPVDIAVFNSSEKNEDSIYIIVECKRSNRKDGKSQLEDYLRFSKATLGVWYNGNDRLFLRKYEKEGKIIFKEIPNIPLFKQRIEDIGLFKRKDLQPTHNLKATFRSIRNFLAANNIGATRDEVLAGQLINLIFCKIYDEKYTNPDDIVEFRAGINETENDVAARILNLFNEVKIRMADVIDDDDKIELKPYPIKFVVGELQNYSLMDCQRDVIADAFETFIGHSLKGSQGQFFTPRNVVRMIVDILQPTENDKIIDPACGSGGFLIEALKHIWDKAEKEYRTKNWKENQIEKEKGKIATNCIRGIDKDYFLSKVAKAYMNLIGDGTSGIFCEDSLENPNNWKQETQVKVQLGTFDIVVTNPPFGDKIKVEGVDGKLKQYKLAHKWQKDKKTNKWTHNNTIEKRPPQILFIERCLQLLKDGGKMGIVLPDGAFNESETYIRKWLLKKVKIIGIIDVCKESFQPNTPTKTSLIFLQKTNNPIIKDYEIFMGVAYFCGHNRRGVTIENDDIPIIKKQFQYWLEGKKIENTKNYFITKLSQLEQTNFWIPKHFSPYYKQAIDNVINKYKLVKLGDIATFKAGKEPGSSNYIDFIDRNETDIPFIRTGDLVNFSINQIPDKFVDEAIYVKLNQDIRANDILFTKDGKIGIAAMVTENDKVVIASGIFRIRLKKEAEKQYGITPEYLFALLSNKYSGYFQAIRSTVIASTIPHLRPHRIADFDIPIVDSETINKITKIVKRSFAIKNESKLLDAEAAKILTDTFMLK